MLNLPSVQRQLKPFFDDTTLHRGLDYARRGLAHIKKAKPGDEALVIHAACEGSHAQPYNQQIEIVLAGGKLANVRQSSCSCPVSVDCKHVVAALATWISGQSNEGTDGDEADASATARPVRASLQRFEASLSSVPRERPPTLPALSFQLQEWLREGQERIGKRTTATQEVIRYAFDAADAAIRVERVAIKRDGSVSKPKPVDVRTHHFAPGSSFPRYANADDLAIIQLLRMSEASQDPLSFGFTRARLADALGYAVLQRVIATSRLYHGSPDRPIRSGARREGRFSWQLGEHDTLTLHLQTDAGAVIGLPTTPLLYFDAQLLEIGELAVAGSIEEARWMLRLPAVDKAAQPLFFAHLRRLRSALSAEQIPEPPPQINIAPSSAPTIVLHLASAKFEVYARSQTRREERPIAEVSVRYPQGALFELQEVPPLISEWRTAEGAGVIARDVDAELAALRLLTSTGLHLVGQWGFGAQRIGRRPYWTFGDGSLERWRDSMASLLARADAAGFDLDVDPSFPFQIAEVESIDTDLDEAERGGWFDLEIGIVIDGKHVPISKPLTTWLARHPNPLAFLASTEGSRTLLLDLPDGTLVKLPADRVRTLLAPLLEFGVPQLNAKGQIRISRLDAVLNPQLAAAHKGFTQETQTLRQWIERGAQISEIDPAAGFGATLRHYQRSGLAWLQFLREAKLGGVLADDMGLGKTVQALAHLHLDKTRGLATAPTLVVSPTSVLPNWRAEIERFAPELRVLVLHGKERTGRFASIPEFDIVLTTYALLPRDAEVLGQHTFHALILDEGQFLKNPAGRQREVAAALKATHRIVLTGTPVENNLRELWSLFDLALPGLLGSHDRFTQYFRSPIERGQNPERLDMLKRRIRPFLVRRRRAEVLGELPPRTEVVQRVDLEGNQRDLYESLRIAFDKKLRDIIAEKGLAQSQIMILDALLKLRQTCCDPRLVKSSAATKAHGESAKLELLKEMLEELAQEGRRALVFSQFAEMIALIEAELPALGVKYEKIIGDTPLAEREAAVKRFQAGEASVFLISLRAGGTGLNLTAADTVIHYDPWWNPAVEAQATARAHRIGQDKAVFVYKLIAGGTVEERILELLSRKQALADSILAGGEVKAALITEDDIQALLAPIG